MAFFTLVVAVGTCAADDFYYYRGGRVTIKADPGRFSVAAPAPLGELPPTLLGATLSHTINDDIYNIGVYTLESAESAEGFLVRENIMHAAASQGRIVSPGYLGTGNAHLSLTPYLYVRLKDASGYEDLTREATQRNLVIVSQSTYLSMWYVLAVTTLTGMDALQTSKSLYETGLFQESSPDLSSDNDLCCSHDPLVGWQWRLYNSQHPWADISVSEAWNYATGHGVTIAILDQGIDKTHPDLVPNMHPLSYDCDSETSPSRFIAGNTHGTQCAGIAAAMRNNGIGIAGVAPDASIMCLSSRLNNTTTSAGARGDGIMWAYKHGADIISCSWHSQQNADLLEAIDSALTYGRNGLGCVMVFAAGNDSLAVETAYPGSCDERNIVVGNIDSLWAKSRFSQRGQRLDVMAPGQDIWSTLPFNQYGTDQGTSFSCPHVAGIAALMLELNPSLTNQQVHDIIRRTAIRPQGVDFPFNTPTGRWSEDMGCGIANATEAVKSTPINDNPNH